jgi:5-methylcytosine-specific restriction protein A
MPMAPPKHCPRGHRVPHRGDARLFWDQNNWQPMCTPHHNAKTAREDGGFGRRLLA